MRWLEFLVVIIAMFLPFVAMKRTDMTVYIYWTAISALYLAFIAFRRW